MIPVQVRGDGPVKLQVAVPAHAALQLRLLAQVKLHHPGAGRGAVRGVLIVNNEMENCF